MLLRKALFLLLATLAPLASSTAWCLDQAPRESGAWASTAASGQACQGADHDQHEALPDACDHCSTCCSCSSFPLPLAAGLPCSPADSTPAAVSPIPFVPVAPLFVIDRPPAA